MKKQSTDDRVAVLPGDPTIDYSFTLPYGLRPERGVLVPDEQKARFVVQIFEQAGKGDDPGRIAKTLDELHAPPPDPEKGWAPDEIETILRNPAYVGDWGGFGRVAKPLVEPELFQSAQSSLTTTG
jgi:Recombinase